MDNREITPIAETIFRGEQRKFGIRKEDRRYHMHLVGKTGMGKSALLANMIASDINAGHGLAAIDPHGDLMEGIIDAVPSERIGDVVYFNPADINYPVAFNVLEDVDFPYRSQVAAGLIGIFKKIWADSWDQRTEYVLRNIILSLFDCPGCTILDVIKMLEKGQFREKVISKISDPTVKDFWVREYSDAPDNPHAEAIRFIREKIGRFLNGDLLRDIIGQPKSGFKFPDIISKKKIFLANLTKSLVGEDNALFLGAMIAVKLQLAAMERTNIPKERRDDFYFYIDELQNFSTESFVDSLAEAGKYKLNFIVAHQYISQMEEKVRIAIFENMGTLVCFRVGAEDAEFLSGEFAPQFNEEDLLNLPKHNVYIKLVVNELTSAPFSAVILPPTFKKEGHREEIIEVSRKRYGQPQKSSEASAGKPKKAEASVVAPEKTKKEPVVIAEAKEADKARAQEKEIALAAPKKKKESSQPEKKESECWACGEKTLISFQPDGIRPIYCKKCLKKVKKGLMEPIGAKASSVQPNTQIWKAEDKTPAVASPAKRTARGELIEKPVPEPMSLKDIIGKDDRPEESAALEKKTATKPKPLPKKKETDQRPPMTARPSGKAEKSTKKTPEHSKVLREKEEKRPSKPIVMLSKTIKPGEIVRFDE